MRISLLNKLVFESPMFWKGFSSPVIKPLEQIATNIANGPSIGNERKKHKKAEGRIMSTVLMSTGESEPKYDGYQIWVHEDIPDYNDSNKNLINQKFDIKNYSI